jgi:hypothetical protein
MGVLTMKRAEAIAYLTQCADDNGDHWSGGVKWSADECPTCHGTNDAGWLRVPCSRYGNTSAECAPVAYRVAYLMARESGDDVTREGLQHAMSLVVNDSDGPAEIVREYGHRHYI